MHRDTLSDVLSEIRLTGGMFFRVRLRPPFAVSADGVDQIAAEHAPDAVQLLPFHLVTRGPIWFEVNGESVCLNDGDIIVLPHGADHSLSHAPGVPAIPVGELQHAVSGFPPTLQWGGVGPRTEALCGFFQCEGRLFNPLLEALPEVLIVRGGDEGTAWLTSTLERTFSESLEDRPGGAAVVGRLTELLFVDVIQRYLAEHGGSGWFAGVADPVVGPALALIHRSPQRHWSVDELAAEVGASRSMLTERFTELVGLSPIRYLTAWRMELAAQRLLAGHESIAEVAAEAGYDSEAAFNRAFKRHAGDPPAKWRRSQRLSSTVAAAEIEAG